MKKFLTAVCASLMAVGVTAAFAACDSQTSGPEAHTHDLTYVAAEQPTCTEPGHTAYYECSGCGKYYSDAEGENEITLNDTVTPATGHDTTLVEAKAATCTEAGNTAYYVCDNCDKYFSDAEGKTEIELSSTVVPATGHDTTLVEAKAATCTEAGNTAYYVCGNCGKYFSDEEGENEITLNDTVIPATGHDTTLVEAKAATCTEAGNTAYYVCGNCGKYFSDEEGKTEIELSSTVVPATGHDTTLVEAKEATCTEAGNTAYYVCGNCGKYFSDEEGKTEIELSSTVVPATGHDTTLVEAKAATCTEAGNTAYYVCDNCGKYFSDEEGKTEIELSSTVVPATGHDTTLVEAKAATCTEAGNTAYYVCDNCDKYFSDAEGKTEIELSSMVVPATGHDLTANVETAPTADVAGQATVTCSNGDYNQTVVLPALTEENVDNGTYEYSVIFKQRSTTRFDRYGRYTYEIKGASEPLTFDVSLATYVQGTIRMNMSSGSATTAFSATNLATNVSFDDAKYAISFLNITAGYYKLTVNTADVDLTITLIGSDGTIKDLITSSDNLTSIFEVKDGVTYIVVPHSASSVDEDINITVEETEVPTLSLTQTCSTGSLAGGNAMAGQTGGSVSILIDESVAAGTYQIKLTGSQMLGRYNNFVITVNGQSYNTALNTTGVLGAAATVELKGGDIITIANGNMAAMTLTVTLTAV